jgi:hypothetical protein
MRLLQETVSKKTTRGTKRKKKRITWGRCVMLTNVDPQASRIGRDDGRRQETSRREVRKELGSSTVKTAR